MGYQCGFKYGVSGPGITRALVYPAVDEYVEQVLQALQITGASLVYIGTDELRSAAIGELTGNLTKSGVEVIHVGETEEQYPQLLDLHAFSMADMFIGNCLSSFTAIASRMRIVDSRGTWYWGMPHTEQDSEEL